MGDESKAKEQQQQLWRHCRGDIRPRSRDSCHNRTAKNKAPKRDSQRVDRLGCYSAKHRERRTTKACNHARRDAPNRKMKTGKVAIGHCKHAAYDVKDNGNELVGGHVLAIKHAAEHDAKHR